MQVGLLTEIVFTAGGALRKIFFITFTIPNSTFSCGSLWWSWHQLIIENLILCSLISAGIMNYLRGEKTLRQHGKKWIKRLLPFPLSKNTILIPFDGFAPAHNSLWTIFLFASTWSNLSILFILFFSLKLNKIAPCQFGCIDLSSPYLMIT